MALTFHPRRGTVLYCDFSGFRPPEMVKTRPVVIVSSKHNNLCTVVPLSGTEPMTMEPCHHLMDQSSLPSCLAGESVWAKCDTITTVAFSRLDRARGGRDANGKRIYEAKIICDMDMRAIERCIIHVLKMGHLIAVEQGNAQQER